MVRTARCPTYSTISPDRVAVGSAPIGIGVGCITSSRSKPTGAASNACDTRLRADARGRDGGVSPRVGGGRRAVEPDDRGGNNQHPASLNVKTARPPRGILPFTHLAREGRMTVTIGRRELLAALGGAAAAWPLAARAQQDERVRRIGLLMGVADDRAGQTRVTALKQGLQELGWTDGRNIQIEIRFGGADTGRIQAH